MARRARVFDPAQIKDMVERFNAGESTKRIGQRQTPPASAQVVGRVLGAWLGDLRAARAVAKYREGFAAGYRMALTHVNLHGTDRAREYWAKHLLPWREMGLHDVPPEFVRSS